MGDKITDEDDDSALVQDKCDMTRADEPTQNQFKSGPGEGHGGHDNPHLTLGMDNDNSPNPEPTSQTVDQGSDAYSVGLDVDSNDTDSAIGDLYIPSSTASVRSSVYDYVKENGRTYHRYKEGTYMLPNDDSEQERLDLQHQLWLLTLDNKLYLAPISTPHKVLDIGTGTGIWAIEFATEHPESDVVGSDLSPIQPEYVPANCRFEVDDAEDEWTYTQKFNFIHGRLLFSCFTSPPSVIQKAYHALAPGGYLEMQEVYFNIASVDTSVSGTALEKWNGMLVAAAKILGKDWHCTPKFKQYFIDAGFEEVVETRKVWPTNTWPKNKGDKTLGLWGMTNLLDGINAMSLAVLTRGTGMAPEEVELLLVDVRKDIKTRAIHGYFPIYVVYGRKREEYETAV